MSCWRFRAVLTEKDNRLLLVLGNKTVATSALPYICKELYCEELWVVARRSSSASS
jgi:hypothetical protein